VRYERGLSTILHCLQWYNFVLRTNYLLQQCSIYVHDLIVVRSVALYGIMHGRFESPMGRYGATADLDGAEVWLTKTLCIGLNYVIRPK